MLDRINRHVMQPFAAWRNGSKHLQYLKVLKQSQYDSAETIRARQLQQLQTIVQHAYGTVSYYRQLWNERGLLPNRVQTFDDLKQFPILTKSDLRTQPERFLSSYYDKSQCFVKRTSGSTGVPLTITLDERGKQWKYACTQRSDEWSGWRLGQRIAKVWGNPEYKHFGWRGRMRNALLERAVYLDTCHFDDTNVKTFIDTLKRKPPGLLFGHAHSLALLAERVKPGTVKPNGIIATAMPLHSWQRTIIERAFDTKVTDRYGCEEVSLIASECEVHKGMHINADSVYLEIEGGGNTGNLLITDLTNRAMPLIRYRNGDVVTLSSRQCVCGRGLPMLESIQGRDADYVVKPDGSMISGISLTENFALKIPGTAQMQIVQESVHHFRIRIVPAADFDDSSRRGIAGLVRETFGDSVLHDIELLDRIEQEPSGKYRFCISKVAR